MICPVEYKAWLPHTIVMYKVYTWYKYRCEEKTWIRYQSLFMWIYKGIPNLFLLILLLLCPL